MTADSSLRSAIDKAIRPTLLIGLQDADLSGPGGTQRINEWADWIADTLVPLVKAEHRAREATIQAATYRAAADFLRDAHFHNGLTVQEIGTALRHTADELETR